MIMMMMMKLGLLYTGVYKIAFCSYCKWNAVTITMKRVSIRDGEIIADLRQSVEREMLIGCIV